MTTIERRDYLKECHEEAASRVLVRAALIALLIEKGHEVTTQDLIGLAVASRREQRAWRLYLDWSSGAAGDEDDIERERRMVG